MQNKDFQFHINWQPNDYNLLKVPKKKTLRHYLVKRNTIIHLGSEMENLVYVLWEEEGGLIVLLSISKICVGSMFTQ